MGFDDRNRNDKPRPKWQIIDTVVKGDAAIEISELPLNVPRYSFRIGTAYFPENEEDAVKVGPRLTIFNVQDAVELLSEAATKYLDIREDRINELEDRKQRMRDPSVQVRRKATKN